jgi:YfiH family protein
MPERIVPDWPAPARVRAFTTTRAGGVSEGRWATLNLGDRCGDRPGAVAENRRRLRAWLPDDPAWLRQVHGSAVAAFDAPGSPPPEADAMVARRAGQVCAALTADCLPVLLCDRRGTVVAAAHAGWRGLRAGILEHTVRAMSTGPNELLAWLGPGIGADAYEVGDEVRDAFAGPDPGLADAFVPAGGRCTPSRGGAWRWPACGAFMAAVSAPLPMQSVSSRTGVTAAAGAWRPSSGWMHRATRPRWGRGAGTGAIEARPPAGTQFEFR